MTPPTPSEGPHRDDREVLRERIARLEQEIERVQTTEDQQRVVVEIGALAQRVQDATPPSSEIVSC